MFSIPFGVVRMASKAGQTPLRQGEIAVRGCAPRSHKATRWATNIDPIAEPGTRFHKIERAQKNGWRGLT